MEQNEKGRDRKQQREAEVEEQKGKKNSCGSFQHAAKTQDRQRREEYGWQYSEDWRADAICVPICAGYLIVRVGGGGCMCIHLRHDRNCGVARPPLRLNGSRRSLVTIYPQTQRRHTKYTEDVFVFEVETPRAQARDARNDESSPIPAVGTSQVGNN